MSINYRTPSLGDRLNRLTKGTGSRKKKQSEARSAFAVAARTCPLRVEAGFTLIEVLISILILAVTVVVFMGGISQALVFSSRGENTTKSLLNMEKILFQLETGVRSDLISYGGTEQIDDESMIKIDSDPIYEKLRGLSLKLYSKEQEELALSAYFIEGGIQ